MNDALGLHDHLYLIHIHLKQPLCLNDFQPFIHHGRGIYGNLLPHGPVGMLQGILHLDIQQFLFRLSSERPSGSCQKNLVYGLVLISLQGLEDRAVLAVHRKDGYVLFGGQRHDNMSCRNQRFLVGKRNVFPRLDRLNGRPNAYHPHYGCH